MLQKRGFVVVFCLWCMVGNGFRLGRLARVHVVLLFSWLDHFVFLYVYEALRII